VENQGYSYKEQVGAEAAGSSVLAWLSRRYTHSTVDVWLQRIAAGELLLDGIVAAPDQLLRAGQSLVWNRPSWEEPPVPLHYEVLHEDEHVLAVCKPSGLPTQPGGGYLEHTLQRLVQRRYPEAVPLHRLGRGTSGIVLFARSEVARRELSAAFRDGRVTKIYRTLVSGSPAWDELDIDVPIGPVPHPLLGTVHAASPAGKASRSLARVVERRSDGTLLDVQIFTGRPHQIRIHMAAVGHPLVGDPLYLPGGHPRPDVLPGDEGYFLHATEVSGHPLLPSLLTARGDPRE
jgi:23S rRNA pseudouridine1911/1915/1917 synthase